MKLSILIFSLFLSFYTNAQFFYQDPDYGNNGISQYDSLHFVCAARDAAGNIYMGGHKMKSPWHYYAVTKISPSGVPDSSFGINGTASFDLIKTSQNIYGLAIQPDGKVVFVGEIYISPSMEGMIGRFTTDGQLDTTFNGTGYHIWDGNLQYDGFSSIHIQPDGKLIAGGTSCFGGQYDFKFAAVRFNSNGTVDNTFGTSGMYRSIYNGSVQKILMEGNKIVLGGYRYANPIDTDSYIMRLEHDGIPDPTFGSGGSLQLLEPGDNYIMDIVKDGTGYIAVSENVNGHPYFTDHIPHLFRVTNTGVLDLTAFGGGIFHFDDPGNSTTPYGLVIKGNSVFVAGYWYVTGGLTQNTDALIFQVDKTTGNLDTLNGTNGLLAYTEPGAFEKFVYIFEEPNGDFLIGGVNGIQNLVRSFVTRYSNAAKVTSITPDVDVCAGNAINLTATALGYISGYQWRKNGLNLTNGANISGATSTSLTISNAGPSDAGNYDLVAYGVTSPPDTSDVAQVTISTAVPATPGAISGPAVVCRSFKYNYSIAPVTGADSYVWSLPPGTQILSGAGTTSVSVQFSNTAGISVHAQNGCGSSQATWLPIQLKRCATHNNNVNSPLRNTNSFTRFEIFPNPASSELNIHFISEIEQPVNIRLFDAIGRMEFDKNIISEIGFNTNELDLSTLISGIYFLEIVMGEEIIREKIVLNRQ